MSKPKLAKSESVRLFADDAEWLEAHVKKAGQDKSLPIRAAVRLLRVMVGNMPPWAQARFIARLVSGDQGDFSSAEESAWALSAMRLVDASGESKLSTREGRATKPPGGHRKAGSDTD